MKEINYSEINNSIGSFILDNPKFFMNFGNKLYSFSESNQLRLHNSSSLYNKFSAFPPTKSKIIYIVNSDLQQTKVFDSIIYPSDISSSGKLSYVLFKTRNQVSNVLQDFDIREDSSYAAIPRSNDSDLFSERMRGKWISSEIAFEDLYGSKLSIPYIETIYRYSRT